MPISLICSFFGPFDFDQGKLKKNKKTPGCIIDSFHYFFRSLIFARLRCAKIYAKRKKVDPEIKNARPDLLFYPSVATNKRGADSGECFF